MSWGSWSDFAAMGGYGPYVWGSFGAVFAALALEVAALEQRWRAARVLLEQARRGARKPGA